MSTYRIRLILALAAGITVSGCDSDAAKQNVNANRATANGGAAATEQATTATRDTSQDEKISAVLAKLPAADLKLVEEQRFCPVHVYRRLGSKGTPVKVETTGKPIFVCSQECVDDVTQGGAAIKRIASGLRKSTKRLSELSAADRATAELQKYCPVMSNRLLGTMGKPIRLEFAGQPVFICCPDCLADAEADPTEMLARVEQLKNHQAPLMGTQGHEHHHHDKHGDHAHGDHADGNQGHDDPEHDEDTHHP